jgi:hypothetical protein
VGHKIRVKIIWSIHFWQSQLLLWVISNQSKVKGFNEFRKNLGPKEETCKIEMIQVNQENFNPNSQKAFKLDISPKKNFDFNTVLAERSYIKPTEDTEMAHEFELRDNFDEGGCGRISLMSDQRTPLLPLK